VPSGVRHAPVNDLLPFLGFVAEHPIGSTVEATTESYSSHGAYVTMNGVRGYVPLRYLGDPAPRSAREVLAMGETSTFVVVSFNPPRRGIDLAKPEFAPPSAASVPLVDMAALAAAAEPTAPVKKTARRTRKAAAATGPEPVRAPADEVPERVEVAAEAPAAAKKAAKRARKAASAVEEPTAPVAPAKKVAKRAKKAAATVVSEPEVAEAPAPAKAGKTVKKAAKRARKAAAPLDAEGAAAEAVPAPTETVAPAPEEPAAPVKKAAKRARKAPAKAAG
jgi:hypothetical protein